MPIALTECLFYALIRHAYVHVVRSSRIILLVDPGPDARDMKQ